MNNNTKTVFLDKKGLYSIKNIAEIAAILKTGSMPGDDGIEDFIEYCYKADNDLEFISRICMFEINQIQLIEKDGFAFLVDKYNEDKLACFSNNMNSNVFPYQFRRDAKMVKIIYGEIVSSKELEDDFANQFDLYICGDRNLTYTPKDKVTYISESALLKRPFWDSEKVQLYFRHMSDRTIDGERAWTMYKIETIENSPEKRKEIIDDWAYSDSLTNPF